jgi:hypothetical protein
VWTRWFVIFIAISGAAHFASAAASQAKATGPEQTLFRLANQERMARGLTSLNWNDALAAAARAHALRMAQQDALSHQYTGELAMADRAAKAGARFSTIAENIGEERQAETLHAEWMESPPHRANLLDPQLDAVGIAVVEKNGNLFAVEDFAQIVPFLSVPEQEKIVASVLRPQGLTILAANEDARQTCLLEDGFAGKTKPAFTARYETPFLQEIPALLEEQIMTGQYHSAAVGACVLKGTSDFSHYRVVVLLY